MDPITAGAWITWLLSTVGPDIISGVAGEAAKGVYISIASRINHWRGTDVALTGAPLTDSQRAEIAALIDQQSSTETQNLRKLADELLALVEQAAAPAPSSAIGLKVKRLRAARVHLGNVTATGGIGAQLDDVETPGDFTVDNIGVGTSEGKERR